MDELQDFSIFDKFEFERQPVGIKYLLNKPDGLEQTDVSLPLCAMFKQAQDSEPFYATEDNFSCMGKLAMGMRDSEPVSESGEIGATEKIFKEARANRRIYPELPKLGKGTVRYVSFSSMNKLTFEPDIVLFTVPVNQAEILLRSLNYSTGNLLTTKYSLVIMCAWMFIYPYVTGKVNFTITGLSYGMKTRRVLPEGLVLISVPFDLIPMMADNLKHMPWSLTLYTATDEERDEYFRVVGEDIRQRYEASS